ncbi:hypothetical protein RA2_01034 [Roseovarius sp. A-2]|uniref:hypothetical protein n=1 Tax=Roseovarius sp. A-2 TaxID=1570360 RepID=UPI0009CB7235|nr:hypothetical protein [Roseovarius sp. A-2]GAW33989.1 hypothetical protein RA2_01034 [Roseovarius sp. A-2]
MAYGKSIAPFACSAHTLNYGIYIVEIPDIDDQMFILPILDEWNSLGDFFRPQQTTRKTRWTKPPTHVVPCSFEGKLGISVRFSIRVKKKVRG